MVGKEFFYYQQFDAGEPGNSSRRGSGEGQPFRWFFPTLERRVGNLPLSDFEGRVRKMRLEIHYAWRDTKAYGSQEAEDTALRLKWAYDALTFYSYSGDSDQWLVIDAYNKFQAENAKKGGVVRGVGIHEGEEKQTLIWMLDKVGVPHNLGAGDICIPFVPLERQMRYASAQWLEQGNEEPTSLYLDHEKKTHVADLMEQWEQTEGNNR